MPRSYCQQPGSCVAGKRGACGLCQARTPEVRARMSAARKKAWAKSGRSLPSLTAQQRKDYEKLRAIVGREAALAEVLR
jgi:hypothetical protein